MSTTLPSCLRKMTKTHYWNIDFRCWFRWSSSSASKGFFSFLILDFVCDWWQVSEVAGNELLNSVQKAVAAPNSKTVEAFLQWRDVHVLRHFLQSVSARMVLQPGITVSTRKWNTFIVTDSNEVDFRQQSFRCRLRLKVGAHRRCCDFDDRWAGWYLGMDGGSWIAGCSVGVCVCWLFPRLCSMKQS